MFLARQTVLRRSRFLILLAFGLAALGLNACGTSITPSQTRNIFGPDNREDLPAGRPYDAIGRLDSGCTGTIIGKRLVLTAAHCVVDSVTGTVKPEVEFFRPGYRGEASVDAAWVESVWLGSLKPEADRLRDFAVLKVDADFADRFGRLTVHEVDIAAALPFTTSLVGYSRDRDEGDRPGLHRGCYVHSVKEGRLFHDCDGMAGVSGGPLLNLINGNTYVAGITVSEYRQGAPDSVRRDAYSVEYTNVAIPASAFASLVLKLQQSVDAGLPAPAIDGIVEKINPNLRPIGPGPDNGSYGDIASMSVLQERQSALRYVTSDLSEEVAHLRDVAQRTGDNRLVKIAADFADASSAVGKTIADALGGRLPQTYGMEIAAKRDRIVQVAQTLSSIDPAAYPATVRTSLRDSITGINYLVTRLNALIRK